MNNHEAQFILLAYRANGADASDPQFRAALEQAKRDPELGRWLNEQRKFDLSVRNKIQSVVVPPPDLKSNLLALGDVVRVVPWWRRPAWVAAAASIALLLAASAALLLRPTQLPALNFADEMVQQAIRVNDHLAISGKDIKQMSQWLHNRHFDGNLVLPPALSNLPVNGCQIVTCKGMSVPMICMTLDGTNHVDVFIARTAGFPEPVPAGTPVFQNSCHLTTVEWSTPDRIYFVTAEIPEDAARKLFGVAAPSAAAVNPK